MDKKIYKVAGLGQCSLDYITTLKAYPEEDTKAEVEGITVQGGGPVATALVALSRLGVKSYFSGIISNDRAGAEIRAGLKKEGVDTRGLRQRPGGESQRAFIVAASSSGTRTIFWQRPTVAPLSANEVRASFLKDKDFLLLDALMPAASIKAATLANRAGVPVMCDAGSVREGMAELLPLCDYVVASEVFARSYAGTPVKCLKALGGIGVKAATVTLGRKGSITAEREPGIGARFTTPAFKVKAVDTTGAGDVFHGGYIYGLLQGWKLERVVEFASAVAALKCEVPGGRSGIPFLGVVKEFMRKRGRKK